MAPNCYLYFFCGLKAYLSRRLCKQKPYEPYNKHYKPYELRCGATQS